MPRSLCRENASRIQLARSGETRRSTMSLRQSSPSARCGERFVCSLSTTSSPSLARRSATSRNGSTSRPLFSAVTTSTSMPAACAASRIIPSRSATVVATTRKRTPLASSAMQISEKASGYHAWTTATASYGACAVARAGGGLGPGLRVTAGSTGMLAAAGDGNGGASASGVPANARHIRRSRDRIMGPLSLIPPTRLPGCIQVRGGRWVIGLGIVVPWTHGV